MLKLALVEPAAMVTVEGTCAADVLLLESWTSAPPVGAGPVNVTVPVELFPPTTDDGLRVIEDRVGGLTVRLALRVMPYVPEIATEVLVRTADVETVKVAVVDPAETATLTGTRATAVLLLSSATTAPPLGAAAVRVTVPVELLPPTNDDGLSPREEIKRGAATVIVAVRLTPKVPVMTDDVSAATELVVTMNVAEVLPANIVTVPGTWAAAVLLLPKLTVIPPVGAAPLIVTVPVELFPP
jgi:hypothetical protein